MKPSSLKRFSPVIHRAFLFLAALVLALPARAQADKFGKPTDRAASGKADQKEGARILENFRGAGIAGDYWLSFELRVMPRQGEERTLNGTMVGKRGSEGPISRLAVGNDRWLIESGPRPDAWSAAADKAAQQLSPGESGQAIGGTNVTLFELQMPFLYWTDFVYEGEARMRGRPTHSIILRPPPGVPTPIAGLTGVRVLIDSQFQALVQAEELGANNAVIKTITLLDLKKVEDRYIMKAIDVKDVRTRDKTRFAITAVAVGLHWPAETFSPAQLATDIPAPPKEKIQRF